MGKNWLDWKITITIILEVLVHFGYTVHAKVVTNGLQEWCEVTAWRCSMVMIHQVKLRNVLYIDVAYKDQRTKKIEWSCPRQAWCSYKKNMDP